MINLLIGEDRKLVKLYPGTQLQMEKKCDFFQLLSMNFVFGYDFIFPREGNEHIFLHAGDTDNTLNRFNDGYAAELQVFNNTFLTGTFTLKESDDKTSYRGTFDSISKEIYNNLDTKLSGILDEYNATLYARQNVSFIAINDSKDPWVKFPRIDTFFSTVYNLTDGSSENIAFFNMLELLKRTLKELGYTLVDLATTNGDVSQKIYLPGRRINADTKELRDVCPDLTVRELLKSVAILTAGDISILEKRKEVVIQSWDSIIDDPRFINFSDVIYKEQTERNQVNGIRFSFDNAAQEIDGYIQENPESLQGNKLADVDDIASLPAGSLGDYCFVIQESAYYRYAFNESTQQEQWDYYAEEIFSREETAEEESVEVVCPCTPVHRDRYQQIPKVKHNFTITDNGSGKVRITITSTPVFGATFPAAQMLVRIPGVYDEWVEVIGSDPLSDYWDMDINYIEDATHNSKVIDVKNRIFTYHAQIDNKNGEEFPADYDSKLNASLRKRIVIWHGAQLVITDPSSTTEYIATSDNQDNRGNTIAPYALRWNGPDNMIDQGPWKRPVAFIKSQPRILRQFAWLNDAQLQQLTNTTIRKVKSKDAMNLVRKVRYLMQKGDKVLVEMEGYRF